MLYEQALVEQLNAALAEIPGAVLDPDVAILLQDGWADAVIDVAINGRSLRLFVLVKRSAFPRDVRESIWQLHEHLREIPDINGQRVPMVASETVSPGARKHLQDARVGYFDESGSLYIPADGVYVLVDRPMAKRQKRSINAVFTGRRAQVLHAAWVCRREWFGVQDVAERAQVSPATASQTLTELERRDWVEVRGSGPTKERRLSDRRALLDAWAQHQRTSKPPEMRTYYVPESAVAPVVRKLDAVATQVGADYEITGAVAGQAHAPYMSHIGQIQCRIGAERADAVLAQMNARSVIDGWNLAVIRADSPSDFAFRERNEFGWIADPLQTYLDLLQGGGRSSEFADHLRAERLPTP